MYVCVCVCVCVRGCARVGRGLSVLLGLVLLLLAKDQQKTWYSSRFVRVILAQGPC